MSQQTEKTEQDTLNTQSVTDEKNNSNYLNEEIEGTPFRVIGNEEEGYIVVMGKYKVIKEKFKTTKEIEEYLANNYYTVTFNMVGAIMEINEEINMLTPQQKSKIAETIEKQNKQK